MEKNTSLTFLMKDKSTKLVDIIDYPDLEGSPENLDVTTLSDTAKRYIPGIKDNEALEFTANYEVAKFKELKLLEGQLLEGMGVWFGGTVGADGEKTPTGADGKFTFNGYVSVAATGGEVNGVRQMKVTVTLNSEVIFSDGVEE